MSADFHALRAGWEAFALLAGTAGAVLAGLLFVGISFGARLVRRRGSMALLRAYSDPALLCFVLNVGLGAALLMPSLSRTAFGGLTLLVGALWTGYSLRVLGQQRAAGLVGWDLSDWLWYALMPLATGLLLSLAGVTALTGAPALALALTAAALVALLATGLRNTWDLVSYSVAHGASEAD